jgi:hypothetical protein
VLVFEAAVEKEPSIAHPNARLTPPGLALLASRIGAGWTIAAAARAAGISRQTGSKWWHRVRAGEVVDRSSRVRHQARAHPPELVAKVCARRLQARLGPDVGADAHNPHAAQPYPCRGLDGSIRQRIEIDRSSQRGKSESPCEPNGAVRT